MKRIFVICLLLLLMVPTYSLAAVIAPARVRLVDGDVLFRTPDSEEWLPAAINTPLDEGDALWCPDDARAEIQLADGSIVRLDQGSQLDLLANEDGFTHLHLSSGRAYLRTAQTLSSNALQIDADDTTVLPAARTRLRLDILPNSQEDVSIFKGSAYVEGNGSRTKVRAGQHIALEDDHTELLSLNPPDSWEDWNMDRDRELSRTSRGDSYLPEELRGYSADLDSSGSWVRVPEYGMVWRPTVVFSADWAPYRSGRWIWKGDDYVWLSSENWGWVPYHYGRWAVVSGFGWCWVPPARGDVYWGPGYVGWYRTGSHIGWTPLAPGESYYGRRHYGRNSVDITNTRINAANLAYRNRQLRGGLTVLPQNDFLRGRSASQAASINTSVSVSIGSPRIQPLRETRMPIVKQTPPRVVPPRVEHRDSRELRQRFPRITPAVDSQRRQQQTIPVAPVTPSLQIKEKRTVHPVSAPAENRSNPVVQQNGKPQQPENQQQPSARPVTIPVTPSPSGTAPERVKQPRRTPGQPTGHQPQTVAPSRAERRQNVAVPAANDTPDQPGREPKPKEIKEKRVWRITAPEESQGQGQGEKGRKEGERRGK